MEELQKLFVELASLFGYEYDDSFFDYLKSISIPNVTTCGKEIKVGDGGWSCEECSLKVNTIYCNDCFIKENHLNHKIYYDPNPDGFCDCGDNSMLKPEGFCDKHKGEYNNINDLMDYIKSSINEKLLDNINNIFNKIFNLFIDKIKFLYENNNNDEDEEEEANDDEIYKMFEDLEIFIKKLYENNLSLFYYFILKFTENFPYETNHKCFNYDDNRNLITLIEKNKDEKHLCTCPFMQVMIYTLKKRKNKQNHGEFFNLFFHTYKNKIITSLSYLNCFSELFYTENLKAFIEMEFLFITENLSLIVSEEHNLPFLEKCFEDVYCVCVYFLKQKEYEKLYLIIRRFYFLFRDLLNSKIIHKIDSCVNLMNILINICCLPNNENVFENKRKFNVFQNIRYKANLANVEIYCLYTTVCLIHIINFENKEVVNSIFNVIFEKLHKFKKYKVSLPGKIFSPHIVIIKCYSLLLNRFCFYYSIKHKCDLLESFTHFLDIFPQYKELNIFIFKELISFFGFIISQNFDFFESCYGKYMNLFFEDYFNINLIYIKCDITLM